MERRWKADSQTCTRELASIEHALSTHTYVRTSQQAHPGSPLPSSSGQNRPDGTLRSELAWQPRTYQQLGRQTDDKKLCLSPHPLLTDEILRRLDEGADLLPKLVLQVYEPSGPRLDLAHGGRLFQLWSKFRVQSTERMRYVHTW